MKNFLVALSVLAFVALSSAKDVGLDANLDHSTKIVNGQDALRGQFPHQALIFLQLAENQTGICGGVLVTPNHVLTAGHCVLNVVSFEIHLGALVRQNFTEPGRVIRRTSDSILHPYYVAPITLNDIAILHFAEPVEFSDFVAPVKLPEVANYYHGINAIASGFGLQNTSGSVAPVLQWASLQTINNLECYQTFGFLVARASVICAVGRERQSACNGDSGGPLITENGVLIGLTSFGSGEGCHHGHPTVFTRVNYFLGWIREVLGPALPGAAFLYSQF